MKNLLTSAIIFLFVEIGIVLLVIGLHYLERYCEKKYREKMLKRIREQN